MDGMATVKVEFEPPQPRDISPSHPLASAWHKYNRGVAHFRALTTVARAHMTATSDEATIEQRRLDPLTIAFYAALPQVGWEIGALVGDVAEPRVLSSRRSATRSSGCS